MADDLTFAVFTVMFAIGFSLKDVSLINRSYNE